MNAPIEPGMWVECIDAGPLRLFGLWATGKPSGLAQGALYRVADVGWHPEAPRGCKLLAGYRVWLVGARRPDGDDSWGIRRFKPVYRPKFEILQSLLQPAPRREAERV